jgi:peptidoglycan/xylan/chitin deacetylase (PgdA/CDA1 family)
VDQHIKVLMYHRIVEESAHPTNHWTCVRLEEFRAHLLMLDRLGFTTITFHDYRLAQLGEVQLPLKPIILTFDDGYAEIHDLAFPAMRNLGMKGVVFVLANQKIRMNYWDEQNGIPHAPLMITEHIRRVQAGGFEIGSHSMNHAQLGTLGEEDAWNEISGSKAVIEALLDAPIETFSYPYGISTPHVRQMVIDAGYEHACGVYTGPPTLGADPFDIRRITVPRGISAIGFAARLLTPYDTYEWVKRKTSIYFQDRSRTHPTNGGDSLEEAQPSGSTLPRLRISSEAR